MSKSVEYLCNIWQHDKYGGNVVSFHIAGEPDRKSGYLPISGKTVSGRAFRGCINPTYFSAELAAGRIKRK